VSAQLTSRPWFGRCIVLIAVFFGLFAVSDEAGSQPKPKDLDKTVKALLDQLADPAKQAEAEAQLLKLGPDALEFIPEPSDAMKPALKKKVQTILATLREAQAQRDLAPRTVNLSGTMALSKAIEAIEKQTGMSLQDLRVNNGGDPSLKLELKSATYWQALDSIAREADLNLALFQRGGTPGLADGPYREQLVSYAGMFRVAVKRVTSVFDLELDARQTIVQLEIAWEPRFQPLFLQNQPENLSIQDDKGTELKAIENQGRGRAPVSNRFATTVDVPLESPRRAINKLGLLKGNFSVVGPTRMLTFTFDKLARVDRKTKPENVPTQTKEGVTIKMHEFKPDAELWTFGLTLEYPKNDIDFESFESWIVNNEAKLVRLKDNKSWSPGGFEVDEQGATRATLTYHFVEEDDLKLGKPDQWRFEYKTPGMMVKIPIPFEFKDIPLP
jgi:hypothetical protein